MTRARQAAVSGARRAVPTSLQFFSRLRWLDGKPLLTVRNLEIVQVDVEDNVILVKGAVPGPNGGYVILRRSKQ